MNPLRLRRDGSDISGTGCWDESSTVVICFIYTQKESDHV